MATRNWMEWRRLIPVTANCIRSQSITRINSIRLLFNTSKKSIPSSHCTIAKQPRRFFLSNPFRKVNKRKGYKESKLVGYSPDEVFQVVADVTDYAEYIPWCRSSKVIRPIPDGFLATLEVGFPPLLEQYTSEVTLIRPTLARAVCKDGNLFRFLETKWKFSPGLVNNPNTCYLEFEVSFEFNSMIHNKIAGVFLEDVVKKMVQAFYQRCRVIYGPDHEIAHLDPIYRMTNL